MFGFLKTEHKSRRIFDRFYVLKAIQPQLMANLGQKINRKKTQKSTFSILFS